MSAVTITGINLCDAPGEKGRRLICFFDAEISGIRMLGCQLVRTPQRGLAAFPPRINDPAKKGRLAVTIIDNSLRHSMVDAARNAAAALGADVAWEPRACRSDE